MKLKRIVFWLVVAVVILPALLLAFVSVLVEGLSIALDILCYKIDDWWEKFESWTLEE